MLFLPPAGSLCPRLPFADRSAVLLAEILLAADPRNAAEATALRVGAAPAVEGHGPPAASTAALTAALRDDPPLTLWVVAHTRCELGAPARFSPLASWLETHALGLLGGVDAASDPPPGGTESDWSAIVVELYQTAGLAARLVEPSLAEAAFLAGLLRASAAVVPPSSGRRAGAGLFGGLPDDGPAVLEAAERRTVAAACEEAAALLAAGDPPLAAAPLVAEARAEADRQAALWMEPVAGAGLLPLLGRRLRRLAELESRFAEALEAACLDAMAEFAAGAGHEINNPLAVIAGRAQLFLQDEADPERRRALALINTQAKRVYEMIADMRLFARPPQPELAPVDLGALMGRLVEEAAPAAAERSIRLRWEGAARQGEVIVTADATQLLVALRALCRNAMEAIGHNGEIEFTLAADDAAVRIGVRDDGPGIAPEIRPQIFNPFFSARQAGRGLGLGLSKCWRIVADNHGGRIEVDSSPGGALFTVTLPRRPQSSKR